MATSAIAYFLFRLQSTLRILLHLFHLSHIDLDGYACQLVTDAFFDNRHFYNSNYGNETLEKIDELFNDITTLSDNEEIMVLISDINLTLEHCEYLENKIQNSAYNIKLQLLDHHISGLDVSKIYEWYHLDDTQCATAIVYQYCLEHFAPLDTSTLEWLPTFVKAVNAIDIWVEDDELFEFGKVCMQMISKSNELSRSLFPAKDVEYKHHLLKTAVTYIDKNNAPIALDEEIYFIKKNYLNISGNNNTLDNIISEYMLQLLEDKKSDFTIFYKDKKVLLTFCLSHISILANLFLTKHPEIDFFINVNHKGYVSMRSNNKVDVSKVAQLYFNGGGHKNASGGVIKPYENSFSYDKVKKQVISILNDF